MRILHIGRDPNGAVLIEADETLTDHSGAEVPKYFRTRGIGSLFQAILPAARWYHAGVNARIHRLAQAYVEVLEDSRGSGDVREHIARLCHDALCAIKHRSAMAQLTRSYGQHPLMCPALAYFADFVRGREFGKFVIVTASADTAASLAAHYVTTEVSVYAEATRNGLVDLWRCERGSTGKLEHVGREPVRAESVRREGRLVVFHMRHGLPSDGDFYAIWRARAIICDSNTLAGFLSYAERYPRTREYGGLCRLLGGQELLKSVCRPPVAAFLGVPMEYYVEKRRAAKGSHLWWK